MPEVSVVVELRVRIDDRIDPVALEHEVCAQGRQAARTLYREALEALDRDLASAGARCRREPRWVATLMGRIRIRRWRIATPEGTVVPLDHALGLGAAEPTPALREAICALGVRVPYRQAAEISARITGEELSHQSAWRILQAAGAAVRLADDAEVERIFIDGEAPDASGPTPRIAVIEADGTFVRAQREDTERFEVKTGVIYTGKAPAGGRRHRRFQLLNKGCYATTADADAFGQRLAATGFRTIGLHRARHVLFVHDGLDELGATMRGWFPGAIHQVDHFHVAERVWQLSGGDPERFEHLRSLAFTDPAALARSLPRRVPKADPRLVQLTATYLAGVAPDLWGIRRLPARLTRGRMWIVGSGVVEKHQDLCVKRRMKNQGMRWTKRGADHLLALQALRICDRWPRSWGVVAG